MPVCVIMDSCVCLRARVCLDGMLAVTDKQLRVYKRERALHVYMRHVDINIAFCLWRDRLHVCAFVACWQARTKYGHARKRVRA